MSTKKVKINAPIILRNDTSENWRTKNPVLRKGEMGIENDTYLFKFGDGENNWNNLPYFTQNLVLSDSGIREDIRSIVISEIQLAIDKIKEVNGGNSTNVNN